MQKIRHAYTRSLLRVLRRPKRSLTVLALLGSLVVGVLAAGWVKMDFFASDLYRLFYVNVAMPAGTSLAKTGETLLSVEQAVRKNLRPDETRAITTYAGLGFTEKEPVVGEHMGQILVTLQPGTTELRSVDEVIDALREGVANVPGPVNVSYMRRKTGPPTSKPINVKVRGDNLERIRSATELLTRELEAIDGVRDIADDDAIGKKELRVRLNPDAITRAGLNPADVARIVRLYAAGEIVAETQHEGKKLQVRVRADPEIMQNIEAFLDNAVPLADGAEIALRDLLYFEVSDSLDAIRHHNQRRAITIEGDIDSEKINTVEVNNKILRAWNEHKHAFPDIDIDLSGEIDDIREGLASMGMLFVVGLALMFLILGTQFNSYTQPMIVLTTVPMAFIGVVLGLLISGHPVSLYTLYGVIALAGIAANDAIVLISTANRKAARGLPRAQALAYASRRRVIPIVITSLTTIAGLFSLAAGIGGESLLWGPVATSIVWGLAFSTVLTLYFIPVVYLLVGSVGRRSAVDMLPPPSPSFFEKSGVGAAVWRYLVRPLAGRHAIADREDLRLLVREPIQLAFYEDGRQAYQAGDYEKAIRVFEDLAMPTDASGLLCALASQANVKYMQVIGWDAGYGARARRFLDRARSCRPNDRRLQRLEVAMQALDAGDELAVEHAV